MLLVIAAAFVSAQLSTIRGGWQFVLEVGAGTGGVYLLRWYWWRINAWSEISAMATALLVAVYLRWAVPFADSGAVLFAKSALTTTAVTTLVWVAVTLFTAPERQEVLVKFYGAVRPDVRGWKPIAQLVETGPHHRDLGPNLRAFVLGTAMVYLALFGVGKLVLKHSITGLGMMGAAALCAWLLYGDLSRRSWKGTAGSEEKPRTAEA